MLKKGTINARVADEDVQILEELSDTADISVSSVIRASLAPLRNDVYRKTVHKYLEKGYTLEASMKEANLDSNRDS